LYYRQTKYKNEPQKLPRQLFRLRIKDKRKKNQEQDSKERSPKKLKKKEDSQKTKKDGSSKSTGLKSALYESPTKTKI